VNRAIRYAKIIKRIFSQKSSLRFHSPARMCGPARIGRAGGGVRARVVSQSLLIPFKTSFDFIQLRQGGVRG